MGKVPDGTGATLLAVCCVVSVGLCAASLTSTVTTRPSDIVDVPSDILPFGSGAMDDLRRKVAQPEPSDSGSPRGDVPVESPDVDQGPDPQQPPPDASENNGDGSGDSGGASDEPRQSPGESDGGDRDGRGTPSLLDRLLAVLPWLLTAAVALVILAYYRDRIAAVLVGAHEHEEPAPADEPQAPPPTPSNEVARVWNEMLTLLALERQPSKTPTEYALEAVQTGADGDLVTTITDTFQEVRYGDRPVTSDRIRRASEALSRLRDQRAGGAES